MHLRVEKNDLAEIAARMVREADQVAEDTAQDLLRDIKQTAPAHVRSDVSVEHLGPMKRFVTVGDKHGVSFDAAMQEYGTSERAAKPYVTPAAERQRSQFNERLEGLGGRG